MDDVRRGIGIGSVLAMILCWTSTHSILWTLVAGLLSWFYVIFWFLWGWF